MIPFALFAATLFSSFPLISLQEERTTQQMESNETLAEESIANVANNLCARISEKIGSEKSFSISPVSLLATLGMCLHAIEPKKKQQFLDAIHLGHLTELQAHAQIAKTLQKTTLPTDFTNGQIEIAQALGLKKHIFVADSFKHLLQKTYAADLFACDELMEQANIWISSKTHGKIPKLLTDNHAALVLMSAIYLHLQWEHEFKKPIQGWGKQDFRFADLTSAPVSMMQQVGSFAIYRGDFFDVLEKPYLSPKGKHLSQLIFLPHDPQDLAKIEREFNDRTLRNIRQNMHIEPRVHLSMPKIKMESKFHLFDLLTQMGLPLNFLNPEIFSDPSLCLNEVIHQTFISIDEKGTEAAAVTAAIICESCYHPHPSSFHVHHAYAYFIMDGNTVLFRGSVADAEPLVIDL